MEHQKDDKKTQFHILFKMTLTYQPGRCRVDVSPTDVSPTENSWMLRPLNKASLGYCVPDQCAPTLDRAPSAAIAASRLASGT
jgi:hypothetical protein